MYKRKVITRNCATCNVIIERTQFRGKNAYCSYAHRPAWNKGKTGFTPWNKEIPMTQEQKKKLSKALQGKTSWNKGIPSKFKGIKRSPEVGRKISATKNKGLTPLNKLARQKFYIELVPQILARDNYTCQICSQYSGILHVDHIKSWAEYPELRFELSNCRTVCRSCHYYITFKRKIPRNSAWGLKLNASARMRG